MEKTDDPIIFVLQIGTLSQAIKQNTFKKLLRVIKSSKLFVKKEQVHLQKEVYILITLFVTLIPSILQKGNLSKERKEGFCLLRTEKGMVLNVLSFMFGMQVRF